LRKLPAQKKDFRLIFAIPLLIVIISMGIMALPGMIDRVEKIGGPPLLIGLTLFLWMMLLFNGLNYYLLAKIFHKELLNKIGEFIVVEIELNSSYQRFHLLPNDVGIMFYKNGNVYLRTINSVFEIEPENLIGKIVTAGPKKEYKAIHFPLEIQGEYFDWVFKPIYIGFNPLCYFNQKRKINWFFKKYRSWVKKEA
jgi:hypothetical protein